jgi:hypothetical protein
METPLAREVLLEHSADLETRDLNATCPLPNRDVSDQRRYDDHVFESGGQTGLVKPRRDSSSAQISSFTQESRSCR